MPKPRYSPPTPEAEARVKRMVALYREQQDIEAAYKKALAELVDPAGDAMPIAFLAAQLGVERKTVYRHLGRSMT